VQRLYFYLALDVVIVECGFYVVFENDLRFLSLLTVT